MPALTLRGFPAWVLGIIPNEVKNERLRSLVIAYQIEAEEEWNEKPIKTNARDHTQEMVYSSYILTPYCVNVVCDALMVSHMQ